MTKPKKEPMQKRLHIRVSKAEQAAIAKLAEQADKSVSDFVVEKVLHERIPD